MGPFPLFFAALFAFPTLISALYKDQVDKFDWKTSYIGKLKYADIDSKRVVISTEENVVASLALKNGQIAWRQVMEDPEKHQTRYMHVNKFVTTVSTGDRNVFYVRGWDLNTGHLLHEWTIQTTENHQRELWAVNKDDLLHIVPYLGSHIEVTTYKLQSGDNKNYTAKIVTPWISDLSKCQLAQTFFACISTGDSLGTLYYMDLASDNNKVFTFKIEHLLGNAAGTVEIDNIKYPQPAILLTRNSVSRLVILNDPKPQILPFSLEKDAISVQNGDDTILIQTKLTNGAKTVEIQSITVETSNDEKISVGISEDMQKIKPICAVCRGTNCRLLSVTNQDTLVLFQMPNGQIQWQRDESLANVLNSKFIELPMSDLDVSIENEFSNTSNDILSMFVNRLLSQFKQFSNFFSGDKDTVSNKLVRDEFGFQKLLLLVTKNGKIFGVDSKNGEKIWSVHLDGFSPFKNQGEYFFVVEEQRTMRHAPLKGVVTLIGRDVQSGNGILYTFDPMTGESQNGIQRLPYKIKQVMVSPYENNEHLKPLLIQTNRDLINLHPDSTDKSLILKHAKQLFTYTIDKTAKKIIGYTLAYSNDASLIAKTAWEFDISNGEIIDISTKSPTEKIHSLGRVMSDRSVLYKYLNPNLIAVALLTNDTLHKHVVSVYIIDGITGFVVYSVSHKRACQPVKMHQSENWLVYSYFNERFRRVEVASVELYEGNFQNNQTVFSSYSISSIPHAETQSFILPANIQTLQSTLTDKGITNKHILFGLNSGAILEIPYAFLQPRSINLQSSSNFNGQNTPVTANLQTGSAEEGYVPYIPELPVPSEAVINYYKTVERVNKITVSPARLESTSLVFANGLDHFCTRISPSKQFDVLKEDFDHWLIIMVLVALTLASYFTKELASRKALKQAWK